MISVKADTTAASAPIPPSVGYPYSNTAANSVSSSSISSSSNQMPSSPSSSSSSNSSSHYSNLATTATPTAVAGSFSVDNILQHSVGSGLIYNHVHQTSHSVYQYPASHYAANSYDYYNSSSAYHHHPHPQQYESYASYMVDRSSAFLNEKTLHESKQSSLMQPDVGSAGQQIKTHPSLLVDSYSNSIEIGDGFARNQNGLRLNEYNSEGDDRGEDRLKQDEISFVSGTSQEEDEDDDDSDDVGDAEAEKESGSDEKERDEVQAERKSGKFQEKIEKRGRKKLKRSPMSPNQTSLESHAHKSAYNTAHPESFVHQVYN